MAIPSPLGSGAGSALALLPHGVQPAAQEGPTARILSSTDRIATATNGPLRLKLA